MKRALSQRTFMVPSLATLFAVLSESIPGVKFDFQLIVAVMASALIWSAIETVRDVIRYRVDAEFKVGQFGTPPIKSSEAEKE